MDNLVEYLKNTITDKMALEDIVNTFEQMCLVPLEDDVILFETGTFSFTDEPLFYFSLVRQFQNDDEEYIQIHVDVLYKPTDENAAFQEAAWSDALDEPIFDYIRKSPAFAYAKDREYVQFDIFMNET